jgi:hypothetical protein
LLLMLPLGSGLSSAAHALRGAVTAAAARMPALKLPAPLGRIPDLPRCGVLRVYVCVWVDGWRTRAYSNPIKTYILDSSIDAVLYQAGAGNNVLRDARQ